MSGSPCEIFCLHFLHCLSVSVRLVPTIQSPIRGIPPFVALPLRGFSLRRKKRVRRAASELSSARTLSTVRELFLCGHGPDATVALLGCKFLYEIEMILSERF